MLLVSERVRYKIKMKYLALLRGINVGGKNKVSMPVLKLCFEHLGFLNVTTYINSGNVLFEAGSNDVSELVTLCEAAIEKEFGFHVVCAVIPAQELIEALSHAPTWWGKGDAKHNALFVIAPKTAGEIMREVGESRPEYERVAAHHPIIFWSAPVATFSRTRYSKIVGTQAYRYVTIRNFNTTRRLAELCLL